MHAYHNNGIGKQASATEIGSLIRAGTLRDLPLDHRTQIRLHCVGIFSSSALSLFDGCRNQKSTLCSYIGNNQPQIRCEASNDSMPAWDNMADA